MVHDNRELYSHSMDFLFTSVGIVFIGKDIYLPKKDAQQGATSPVMQSLWTLDVSFSLCI